MIATLTHSASLAICDECQNIPGGDWLGHFILNWRSASPV
jgi:hypothetical protein